MNKTTLRLINDSVRQRAKELVDMAPDNYKVTIEEDKPNRSGQQNRRLHKIIGMCSKESGYTIEEMKMTFKRELLAPISHFDYKGTKCPIFKSTADMKVAELNEFMEGVENLAAQWYSVILPAEER